MPANSSTTVPELNSPKSKQRKPPAISGSTLQPARPILLTPQSSGPAELPLASRKQPNYRRRLSVAEKSPLLLSAPVVSPFLVPVMASAPARQALALLANENEDSIITGTTRSLHRRLLGLNLPQSSSLIESQPNPLSLPDRRPATRSATHLTQTQPNPFQSTPTHPRIA